MVGYPMPVPPKLQLQIPRKMMASQRTIPHKSRRNTNEYKEYEAKKAMRPKKGLCSSRNKDIKHNRKTISNDKQESLEAAIALALCSFKTSHTSTFAEDNKSKE
jgi:hypothetical protein